MEGEADEKQQPECPYCSDVLGNCNHVLLDYDASFMEFNSGYLADNDEEIEQLKSRILQLLQSAREPELKNRYLRKLWDYAAEYYEPGQNYIEFDEASYLKLLEEMIDSFDGESYHYEGEDGAAGYSSACIMFFAKDPRKAIQDFNEFICNELIR